MARPHHALLSLLALSGSACGGFSDSGLPCRGDIDCNELCNNAHECSTAEEVMEVRIEWTVGGVKPSPLDSTPCGMIADLEVTLASEIRREAPVQYFPVPCELGQVYYDRMPRQMRELQVVAYDANGNVLGVEVRRLESDGATVLLAF